MSRAFFNASPDCCFHRAFSKLWDSALFFELISSWPRLASSDIAQKRLIHVKIHNNFFYSIFSSNLKIEQFSHQSDALPFKLLLGNQSCINDITFLVISVVPVCSQRKEVHDIIFAYIVSFLRLEIWLSHVHNQVLLLLFNGLYSNRNSLNKANKRDYKLST